MTRKSLKVAKQLVKAKPKFRKGQVVSVRSFYGNFDKGEVGPGFQGKRRWRHGFKFGKIVKIMPPLPKGTICYFLDGWMSAVTENDLRALSNSERGERHN